MQQEAVQRENFRTVVTPPHSLDALRNQKCLYLLSVGPSAKKLEALVQGYRWTTEHFSECSILVGDSLYRITLQIQEGSEPAIASATAHTIGSDLLREFEVRLGQEPAVIRTSDVAHGPGFSGAREMMVLLYSRDDAFRISIDADAQAFVERQHKHDRLALPEETALDLSRQYLLEEIAIYLALAEQGWLVDVYLGNELPTLKRIIDGEIPTAPGPLKRRINVALDLKRFNK